jgi:hypothetical protein
MRSTIQESAKLSCMKEISGFRRNVDEVVVLVICCETHVGSSLPTFRDGLSIPTASPLRMAPIGCPRSMKHQYRTENIGCVTALKREDVVLHDVLNHGSYTC